MLVVIAILGILMSLLLPAVQASRGAARKAGREGKLQIAKSIEKPGVWPMLAALAALPMRYPCAAADGSATSVAQQIRPQPDD